MTPNDHPNLEPIHPARARDLYLEHKSTRCSNVTVQSHEYRLNFFVEWCDANDITNMNELSGRDLHEFRLWRKAEGGLNKISMQTQMSTLRVFIRWCGSIEAVGQDLYNKVLVPQVTGEEEQRNVMLDSDHADDIIQNLSTCQYASKEHVLFALLCSVS